MGCSGSITSCLEPPVSRQALGHVLLKNLRLQTLLLGHETLYQTIEGREIQGV